VDSLPVPLALLLGDVDMDQAPILPGDVDESVAVFGMDTLLGDTVCTTQCVAVFVVLR